MRESAYCAHGHGTGLATDALLDIKNRAYHHAHADVGKVNQSGLPKVSSIGLSQLLDGILVVYNDNIVMKTTLGALDLPWYYLELPRLNTTVAVANPPLIPADTRLDGRSSIGQRSQ